MNLGVPSITGLALALGLDSLRASIGLGTLRPSLQYALRVSLAFAMVEATTPLLGMLIGATIAPRIGGWTVLAGPAVLAITGAYILFQAARGRENARVADSPMFVWGLPLSLSLDNLFAGAALGLLGSEPFLTVALIGVVSGLLAFLGLRLGALLGQVVGARSEMIGGAVMMLVAGLALWSSRSA